MEDTGVQVGLPAVRLPLPPEGSDVPFSAGKDLNGCQGYGLKHRDSPRRPKACVLGSGVSKEALQVLAFIVLLQTLSVSCPAPSHLSSPDLQPLHTPFMWPPAVFPPLPQVCLAQRPWCPLLPNPRISVKHGHFLQVLWTPSFAFRLYSRG